MKGMTIDVRKGGRKIIEPKSVKKEEPGPAAVKPATSSAESAEEAKKDKRR